MTRRRVPQWTPSVADRLPGWTRMDVIRLKRRVARLLPTDAPKAQLCTKCEPDHGHAARRIGPYLICRCLLCPTLVVE